VVAAAVVVVSEKLVMAAVGAMVVVAGFVLEAVLTAINSGQRVACQYS
jgi:hypothetical protein